MTCDTSRRIKGASCRTRGTGCEHAASAHVAHVHMIAASGSRWFLLRIADEMEHTRIQLVSESPGRFLDRNQLARPLLNSEHAVSLPRDVTNLQHAVSDALPCINV